MAISESRRNFRIFECVVRLTAARTGPPRTGGTSLASRLRAGLLAIVVLGAIAPPGWTLNADGGSCALNVNITFGGSGMKSAAVELSSPSYTMTVTGGDLVPGVAGTQQCVSALGGLSPFRSTGVTVTPGSTASDLWTCEGVLGLGTWDQSWSPTPPSS